MKWKSASSVLCDRRMSLKLKGKFYRTAIRSAMLYGTECWVVKHQHVHKMGVAKMRMLRWRVCVNLVILYLIDQPTGAYDPIRILWKRHHSDISSSPGEKNLDWRQGLALQHVKSLFSKEASATLMNL
ncbi:hypothetical protein PS1_041057 [Malus domestica]